MGPIFILSSERSGSNLLRRILGEHPVIAAPPPPHLFHYFSRLLPYYRDLDDLIEDIHALLNLEGDPYWDPCPTPEQVRKNIRERSLAGIILTFYDMYRDQNERTWVNKEVNLYQHLHRIRHVTQSPKFIYLVRDGRDVMASEQRIPNRKRHPFMIANKWKLEQLKYMEAVRDIWEKGEAYYMKYEDLITNPKNRIRELCEWLGIEMDQSMLAFHQNPKAKEEANKSLFWKNLSEPIMAKNKNKYKEELKTKQVRTFERVAGDVLQLLDYELEDSTRIKDKIPLNEELKFRAFNKLGRLIRHKRLSKPKKKGRFFTVRKRIEEKRMQENESFLIKYPR